MNYKPKSLPAQKALLEKQKMLRKKNKMKTLARGGQLRTGRQLLDNVIITLQDEKEIYDLYKSGMKKSRIKRRYQINDLQFSTIIRVQILKEDNNKDKK